MALAIKQKKMIQRGLSLRKKPGDAESKDMVDLIEAHVSGLQLTNLLSGIKAEVLSRLEARKTAINTGIADINK